MLRAALARETWDLVLADYRLPQLDARQALAVLKQSGLDLPFIIVSGSLDMTARLLNLATGSVRLVLRGHTGGIIGVAVSPDGRILFTRSLDKTLRSWSLDGSELTSVRFSDLFEVGGGRSRAISIGGMRLILSLSQTNKSSFKGRWQRANCGCTIFLRRCVSYFMLRLMI